MVAGAWEPSLRLPRAARLREVARKAAEAQGGRTILWAPVALAFGIWTYFDLPREPSWLALAPLALAVIGLLLAGRSRPLLVLAALAIAGCLLAKAKSDLVATPLVRATTPDVALVGRVEDRAATGRGGQVIVLRVETIDGVAAPDLPRRLRLTGSASAGSVAIGERIAARARLAPLPSPVMPGGFEYGRALWFDGVGGTGRIAGTIEKRDGAISSGLRIEAAIEGLRQAINARIRAHLDGAAAAIAEALITGERGGIPGAVNLSFQVSGLAHVLSISGLHMALVAGGVFWLVRALLAALPTMALERPIKKWAAVVALAAGFFYLLLAGTGVATQRSYIMIAVMFFAILVDRPAISVRNLALAAILILIVQPEAAIQASFQMSFMAVMGLSALYEFWWEWQGRRDAEVRQRRHWALRAGQKLAGALAAAVATTIVAGALSSIPAAHHFGRLAPYSVLANGLALPVIGFLIMPMALAGVILMPLGLEAWPLWGLAKGIDLMIAISDWVASLPGAFVVVRQLPAGAAIAAAAGAAILCLACGPVRLAGLLVTALAVVLAVPRELPDVLIERTGAAVAFRDGGGNLVPAPGRGGRFAVEKWLLANGEEEKPAAAARRAGWTCDERCCTAKVKGKSLAFVRAEGRPIACSGIDILVASFPLRGVCRDTPVRIDRFDVWRNGAHGLTIDAGRVTVTTARGEAGERPWVVIPEPRKDRFSRSRPEAPAQ